MAKEIEDLLRRWKALKDTRGIWESHWQDLAEVLLPKRADFIRGTVPGEKRTDEIYDSIPMQARRGLATAIDGLIKPKTSKWFRLRASDEELNEDDEVKRWLQDTEERMFRAIYARGARFIQRSGEVDNDLVTFGTGILFTGERSDLGGLTFRSLHLRDVIVDENSDGVVDTLFNRMHRTVRQAVQQFGQDNLSKETQRLVAENKPDETVELLQVVRPREDADPDRRDARGLPFKSVVIETRTEHMVRESGFHEFPFAVPRWETAAGEVYGRSPGMLALPDAKTLQQMGKTILRAGHLTVDPPLLTIDDAVIGTVRTFPGGITTIDSGAIMDGGRMPVQPLDMGKNLPLGREMQNDVREQVWAAFFRNVLQLPIDAPRMTATEVLERKEEFIRTIGPVFGQLEADYIGHIAERVFGIMSRAGAFMEAPEVLAGRNVRFEFESPVQRARKQIEAAGLGRAMELLSPIAAIDPTIMDNFDADEIARALPETFGVPMTWIRPRDQVEALRQSRAQAQRTQQVLAAGEQVAGMAEKVVPLIQNNGRQAA